MWWRPARATRPIRATPPPCPAPAATGRACRSTTPTATWSDGAAGRWRSAPDPERIAGFEYESGGRNTRRIYFTACCVERGRSSAGARHASISRRLSLHVLEHGRGRPAIDLQSIGFLVGAERGAGEHSGFAVD